MKTLSFSALVTALESADPETEVVFDVGDWWMGLMAIGLCGNRPLAALGVSRPPVGVKELLLGCRSIRKRFPGLNAPVWAIEGTSRPPDLSGFKKGRHPIVIEAVMGDKVLTLKTAFASTQTLLFNELIAALEEAKPQAQVLSDLEPSIGFGLCIGPRTGKKYSMIIDVNLWEHPTVAALLLHCHRAIEHNGKSATAPVLLTNMPDPFSPMPDQVTVVEILDQGSMVILKTGPDTSLSSSC